MEQRDYLLRQLQMMTQAIVALIRRLTGLKEQGSEEETRQVTDVMLKEYFETSLEEIIQTPTEESIQFLLQNKKLHPSVVDMFADVLILNANSESGKNDAKKLLSLALELLQWSDASSKTYSAERHQKITAIRKQLETNK